MDYKLFAIRQGSTKSSNSRDYGEQPYRNRYAKGKKNSNKKLIYDVMITSN